LAFFAGLKFRIDSDFSSIKWFELTLEFDLGEEPSLAKSFVLIQALAGSSDKAFLLTLERLPISFEFGRFWEYVSIGEFSFD
jgi:hypothetical protein